MTTRKTQTKRDTAQSTTRPADFRAEPYPSDVAYLDDEMAWIEARARRIGAERQLASLGLPEAERRYGSRDERSPASLRAQRARHLEAETGLRARIDARLAVHGAIGRPLAVDRLVAVYGLGPQERTVLLLAMGPCLSRTISRAYGLIDGEECDALTIDAALGFLEIPTGERVAARGMFGPSATLLAADLVTLGSMRRSAEPKDVLGLECSLTSRTFSLMVGRDGLGDEFEAFSSIEEPRARLGDVVLDPRDKARILSVVDQHGRYLACRKAWGFDDVIAYGRGVLMLFHGKPGTGKTMTAHAVAHHMGRRVLNVDIPTFLEHRESERFLPALFREARLQNAVLFFDECEALFASRRMGNSLMTLLLTELERFEGVAILATNLPEALDEALSRRILVKVRFPEPDRQARLEIWRRHLPQAAPIDSDVDLEALADRFEIAGGYIKNAVLMAVAQAVHTGGERPAITMAMLDQAARDQLCQPGENLGDAVMPAVRLADVVLPEPLRDTVREIIDAARSRRTVLERWGVGAHLTWGKGLAALLYGPPGTGKTLCAEAIAGELGRPLLAASVAALKSKWVGETERNLEHLFKEAESSGAVLLLDEADGLLRTRGEPNGTRHDDAVTGLLLTLLERHAGLVLLATNLQGVLDLALTRRLAYRLYLPLPDARARAAIWRRLVPESAPRDGRVDFDRLGERFRLSGGHIRNAVMKAAFRAASQGRCLDQALLERTAVEELPEPGGEVDIAFSGEVS